MSFIPSVLFSAYRYNTSTETHATLCKQHREIEYATASLDLKDTRNMEVVQDIQEERAKILLRSIQIHHTAYTFLNTFAPHVHDAGYALDLCERAIVRIAIDIEKHMKHREAKTYIKKTSLSKGFLPGGSRSLVLDETAQAFFVLLKNTPLFPKKCGGEKQLSLALMIPFSASQCGKMTMQKASFEDTTNRALEKMKQGVTYLRNSAPSYFSVWGPFTYSKHVSKQYSLNIPCTKITFFESLFHGDLSSLPVGLLSSSSLHDIALQVVWLVYQMHGDGRFHGDIKAKNFLWQIHKEELAEETSEETSGKNKFRITLIDFDKSFCPDSANPVHTNIGHYYGTPIYTPPEVFANTDFDFFTAESWCVGTVLYFLVFGHCFPAHEFIWNIWLRKHPPTDQEKIEYKNRVGNCIESSMEKLANLKNDVYGSAILQAALGLLQPNPEIRATLEGTLTTLLNANTLSHSYNCTGS